MTWTDIEALDDIHRGLDTAVLDVYNRPHNLTDEEIKEIALAALYLASDESSFVTGAAFNVDGGITAGYVTPE